MQTLDTTRLETHVTVHYTITHLTRPVAAAIQYLGRHTHKGMPKGHRPGCKTFPLSYPSQRFLQASSTSPTKLVPASALNILSQTESRIRSWVATPCAWIW